MRKPSYRWVFLLLLWSVCFLIYAPSLHGDFLWDDDAYISQNVSLQNLQGLKDIWFKLGSSQQYYPVTFTAFWLERHLWGFNPLGYHAVNVLLHGTNAFLVGTILEGLAMPGAWIAAALYAVHPVMAESVAWMTELKNVLSTFFYLLAVLCLFNNRRVGTWFFGAALLSKSVTVTLPVSYWLLSAWRESRWEKKEFNRLPPYFAMGIGMAFLTMYYEHRIVRAQGALWAYSWPERIGIAGHAFWFYLGKLFYPSALCFIYPRWPLHGALVSSTLYAGAAIILLTVAAYGRRVWGKIPFACLLFFAISLLPSLGLTSFYFMRFSFVADHFQYLAAIGIFALAGWALAEGLKRLGVPETSPAGVFLCLLLCADLAAATASQSRKYANSMDLWKDTLAQNPDAAIAYHNLGIALANQNQWKDAIAHLRTAEALDPTFRQTHVALAYFAVRAKNWDAARHEYQEAIRLGEDDPQILKDYASLPRSKASQNR